MPCVDKKKSCLLFSLLSNGLNTHPLFINKEAKLSKYRKRNVVSWWCRNWQAPRPRTLAHRRVYDKKRKLGRGKRNRNPKRLFPFSCKTGWSSHTRIVSTNTGNMSHDYTESFPPPPCFPGCTSFIRHRSSCQICKQFVKIRKKNEGKKSTTHLLDRMSQETFLFLSHLPKYTTVGW